MIQEPGYFYNPIKRDIVMIQGDTCSFAFQLQGLEGVEPDSIIFTCKETVESSRELFQVSTEDTIDKRSYDESTDTFTYSVRIPPYLTHDIALGRYFYDLQFVKNADVITLMTGRLTLEAQITTSPTPYPGGYGDGDIEKYPQEDLPPTEKKVFSTSYISHIADKLKNDILEAPGTWTTEELAEVLDDMADKASDISSEINDLTGGENFNPYNSWLTFIQSVSEQVNSINNVIYLMTSIYRYIPYDELAEVIANELDIKYDIGEEVYY